LQFSATPGGSTEQNGERSHVSPTSESSMWLR
jgi:hypothetical protein